MRKRRSVYLVLDGNSQRRGFSNRFRKSVELINHFIVLNMFIFTDHRECQPGEFQCRNGQCIPEKEQCDLLPNCYDKSDEYDCKGTSNVSHICQFYYLHLFIFKNAVCKC